MSEKPARGKGKKKSGDQSAVSWDPQRIRALREHMNMTQQELADELEVRQQTISEWETGLYTPRRSTQKYLTMVAERAGFPYQVDRKASVSTPEAERPEVQEGERS
jgi:DNA-binding transcriptional regulator YiaG